MSLEKEYCTGCKQNIDHKVEYKTKSNGEPWRDGECTGCGLRRQLPTFGINDGEFKLPYGKFKGVMLKDVDTDYLEWLLTTSLSYSMSKRIESVLSRTRASTGSNLEKYEFIKKSIADANLEPRSYETVVKFVAQTLGV